MKEENRIKLRFPILITLLFLTSFTLPASNHSTCPAFGSRSVDAISQTASITERPQQICIIFHYEITLIYIPTHHSSQCRRHGITHHGPQGHTYNNFNQLTASTTTSVSSGTQSQTQTVSYSYDQGGRLISQSTSGTQTQTYTYNGFGYMVSARTQTPQATSEAAYTYSYDGKRISKYIDGTLYDYTYSASNLLETYADTAGRIAKYTYGHALISQSSLSEHGTLNTEHILTDYQNSVIATLTPTPTLYAYSPFGKLRYTNSEGTPQPLGWLGRQYDSETGNNYLINRYYSSDRGNFLSPDQYEYVNNAIPFTFNLYQYGYANPLMNVDPEGTQMAAESMVNVNRAIRQNLSDEEIERHIDDIVLLKTGFVYDAPKDFAVGMVMAIPSILRMETEQQLRLINTTTDFISDMSHHGVEAAIHKQKVIQQARNDQIREAIRQGFKNWKKKMATDPRFVGKEGGLLILNFAMAIWTGTSMAERTAARALSPAAVEAEPAVAVGSAAEMERIELGIPWLRRTATGRWQLPNGRWASSDIVNRVLTPELRELYELSTPNGLRAARILPGTNGKIAVIARGQEDVVEEMAKILRSKGYDIETIRNVPGSHDAWNEFRDVLRSKRQMFGPNYQLTDAELRESSFYKLDEMWTIGVRDGHYTIIDMGDPFKRGYSGFLNMEYEQTFNWIGR